MTKSDIVRQFWADMNNKDFQSLQHVFLENALIHWPNTKETFSVKEYIYVNQVYPGNWKIEIESIDEFGDKIVSVVRIYSNHENVSLHTNSHFTFSGFKVSHLREYFSLDSEPPIWRQSSQT